jgi:CheY-like chemotaxis protein
MPILNGYEACKQIKQHFDQEKHLFIGEKKLKIPLLVAFSGFVDPET